jgi:hypothetical protein
MIIKAAATAAIFHFPPAIGEVPSPSGKPIAPRNPSGQVVGSRDEAAVATFAILMRSSTTA